MSRILKFRAWSNEHNRYCDFVTLDENGRWIGWIKSSGVYLTTADIILEQDTDLKDKNGKKICEGDIVEITRELTKTRTAVYIYQIKYDSSKAAFTCWKNNHFACMFFENSEGRCEVIGNIHENPELLEKGKE